MTNQAPLGTEQSSRSGIKYGRIGKFYKPLLWLIGTLVLLAVVLYIISFFLDEPLRKRTEATANKHLKGYSVRLPGLRVQLLGGAVTLKGLTVMQNAHPDPPVASFSRVKVTISWRDILSGRIVAAIVFDRPKMHINLQQLSSELTSKEKVKDKGWQEAIEAVYPLKINRLVINDGSITYVDKDPERPLKLSHINVQASNIRNIQTANNVYPSTLHMDTIIFDSGRGTFNGNANFLSQPVPSIKGEYGFEKIPLDYFKPIAARSNLDIRNGAASMSGRIEYSPVIASVQVEDLTITKLEMDYVHTAQTAAAEKKRARKVGKAAKGVSNKPEIQLRIGAFRLTESDLGVVNKDADPPYRVFIADTDFTMTNLTNHFIEGPAKASLTGKFMGSGLTKASAEFRPEKKGPDLDLQVKIENTRLMDMNDLFRAYGNFDVSGGSFLFYSDLRVRNNNVSGYVKPMFKDIKVYDKRKDKEKSAFHKVYEMLVGGVAKLLENKPREEMATKADISGPIENPDLSTFQVLVQLFTNAFFKAILPGFEKEVTSAEKS